MMPTNDAFHSDVFDSQIDLESIMEAQTSASFRSADLIKSLLRSQSTSHNNQATNEDDNKLASDNETSPPDNQTMEFLEDILEERLTPFGITPSIPQTTATAPLTRKRSHDDIDESSCDPFTSGDFRDLARILDDDNDDDNDAADTTYLSSYNPEDVLAERGHRSNKNPGNARYLKAKESLQPRYLATKHKDVKSRIAQELVNQVHSWGGRFLRFDKQKGLWYELDEKATQRKASQALRENLTAEDREAKRKKYGNSKKK